MIRPVRDELKFVIHHSVKTQLLERWRRYLTRDPHTNVDSVTPVLSQYYDSPRFDFYVEKLDGIGFRNKVRLRTYGYRFVPGALAFLEIKQRFFDRIRKIRTKIPALEERDFDPAAWRFSHAGDYALFGILRERYRLCRSAQVWYLREAYQGVVEEDLRVTFDSALTGLYPGERLTRDVLSDRSRSLMPDGLVILEVKATHGIPPWVTDGALTVELQQRPVPKYVIAVERLGMATATPSAGVYAL
jgi:hypothetical protein